MYQWSASLNGVPTTSICSGTDCNALVSTSKQYYTFSLSPYTLQVNKQYVFTVSVLDSAQGLSASRSVTVSVVSGLLVAVTQGGAARSVSAGNHFHSFVTNTPPKPPLTPLASHPLMYHRNTHSTLPPVTCHHTLPITNLSNRPLSTPFHLPSPPPVQVAQSPSTHLAATTLMSRASQVTPLPSLS